MQICCHIQHFKLVCQFSFRPLHLPNQDRNGEESGEILPPSPPLPSPPPLTVGRTGSSNDSFSRTFLHDHQLLMGIRFVCCPQGATMTSLMIFTSMLATTGSLSLPWSHVWSSSCDSLDPPPELRIFTCEWVGRMLRISSRIRQL